MLHCFCCQICTGVCAEPTNTELPELDVRSQVARAKVCVSLIASMQVYTFLLTWYELHNTLAERQRKRRNQRAKPLLPLLASQTTDSRVIVGKHSEVHETLVTCVIVMRCQTYSHGSDRKTRADNAFHRGPETKEE